MERKLSVLFVSITLLWATCSSIQDSEWNRLRSAKRLDNIYGWTTFLSKAEDIDNVSFAQERLAEIKERNLWTRASQAEDPGLLQTYLTDYPIGEHVVLARAKLNGFAEENWNEVRSTTSAQFVADFRVNFKNTSWADSAANLFAELAQGAFERLPDQADEEELDLFIQTWQGTTTAGIVAQKKEGLWNSFGWVRKKNTRIAYERFIQRNPSSSDVSYCRRRIIDIEVDDALSDTSELGGLPAMTRTGSGSGKTTSMSIVNDTGYTLDVLYSGPSSERVTVMSKGETRISLVNGNYRILASVRTLRVKKYFGTETLDGGTYSVKYFITSL